MKKVLFKEFINHDLFLGLVSEDFDYVRIYSVGSYYEVEYYYTSMDCPQVYKYSDVRHALYDFNKHVCFFISR